MSLSREPAREHEPGYPTFSDFDPARRAALRAIALAGLSAAGLQLVGCPGGGSGAPPAGTGVAPPRPTASPPRTDWVPWADDDDDRSVAGGKRPPPVDRPVAIVVGGGPIAVTFSDGATASLAVALVVQPRTTPATVKAGAPGHVAAVQAAARSLPASVLDTAQGLEALGARIQAEVLKATPGLVLEGVQAAPARAPAERSSGAAEKSASRREAGADASAARGESAPLAPTRAPLTGGQVWIPCGTPGCTSCSP